MNRYDIKRRSDGAITHSYTGDSPMPVQPEWGFLERIKPEIQCTPDEIAGALSDCSTAASTIVSLNAGDTILIKAAVDGGSTRSLATGTGQNMLSIIKIGN